MSNQSFYTDGETYALLEMSAGMPPGNIGGLVYCGEPQGIVTKLSYRYKQSEIALELGVAQQTVSRWIDRYAPMRMRPSGWKTLAHMTGEAQSIEKVERDPYARPHPTTNPQSQERGEHGK